MSCVSVSRVLIAQVVAVRGLIRRTFAQKTFAQKTAAQRMWAACRSAAPAFVTGVVAMGLAIVGAEAKCDGRNLLPAFEKSHPAIMAEVRAAAGNVANTEAVLWRLEKDGIAPSYLFGTMHSSDARILELSKPAQEALQSSKVVALEVADLSPGAMMKAVMKMPELMVYLDGNRLDQKMPAAEFETIAGVLSKIGIPGPMASVVRPWLVSILLAVPACEQARAQTTLALDAKIGALSKEKKIPVVGLETIGAQLKAIAAIPEADQLAMLRVSIAFIERREDLFETLIQAYLRRDLGVILALTPAMAKMAGRKQSGFESFSRELIQRRNHGMFDTSLPLVDQGRAFVAVGAAHLIGDTGLVALYRKAGFTVTAVD